MKQRLKHKLLHSMEQMKMKSLIISSEITAKKHKMLLVNQQERKLFSKKMLKKQAKKLFQLSKD